VIIKNIGGSSVISRKIIYQVLNNTGISSNRVWDHRDLQRNAMFDQVFPSLSGEKEPSLGNVIFVPT
jgi:hypothetical protein